MSANATPMAQLCSLIALAAEKGVLRRLVCSKSRAADRVRAVLTPRRVGGKQMLQLETFYLGAVADQLGTHCSAVIKRYTDLNCALNHVVVPEDAITI